ncbi:Sperm-tail PG-rich repeat-containing protein 1 [Tetrabaena socialis]|uniref:Sperm-tail PG-rich repeat-containing protein 1 n=1 Tax=Tetrabaena socialis TaxID=47790 RepID=A0A2J8ABM9_9CHLO|nr:Sperm-tail PG-rich repeat-containing protein 1 [Tetrabaena socialis]|eukprot:PNH09935.1 Sperm-tail PG-rich repeat-containing protein 1 [Tetrabaena socialis]
MTRDSTPQKGQIHKGPAMGAPLKSLVPGYKPVSSIPAKFETILFTGSREKKGFSVESRRFADTDNDRPGPGAYHAQATVQQAESIGKKGFGPLVSQSRRFSDRVCYTGPGPADYRGGKQGAAMEDKGFSRAPVTSAFQERCASSRLPLDRDAPHLGPGVYEADGVTRTGGRLDYGRGPGASSAFKNSTGHEFIGSGNPEAPASTSYDLGDPWDRARSLPRGAMSRAGTSSFGGGGHGGASVGSMATNLDTLLFGAQTGAPKHDPGPGPGTYDLQDFASIRSKLARHEHRASPQFQPLESSSPHRLHAKQLLISAGAKVAHDYLAPSHPPLHVRSPPKGAISVFRSRSAGHEEAMDQHAYATAANAPGPAYYQPPGVLRKSFHRNAKQHYITMAS